MNSRYQNDGLGLVGIWLVPAIDTFPVWMLPQEINDGTSDSAIKSLQPTTQERLIVTGLQGNVTLQGK